MRSILILGGYGNFGKRIAEELSLSSELTIYISGRHVEKAQVVVDQLSANANAQLEALYIDHQSEDFSSRLKHLAPDILIHTSGPFQGQDYHIAKACIEAGGHYFDLADDRQYVCQFEQLDTDAKAKDLLMVSGASSVPGLSSAVVGHYLTSFNELQHIDIAIAPGNKAERGLATVKGILSYTGHPFRVFKGGCWQSVFGWLDPARGHFGDRVGMRWLANVDVPDLQLFPTHFKVKECVSFQAGLELPVLHFAMVGMAYLSKYRLVKNWAPLSRLVVAVSQWFNSLGSDLGAMKVELEGKGLTGSNRKVCWTLIAPKGNGPYIPTLSLIILVKKLLSNQIKTRGAMPCVELFELNDFLPYAEKLDLAIIEHISD